MVGTKRTATRKRRSEIRDTWVPDRRDIICQEMRDVHSFLLVLSPRIFNGRTSLVIGLPMTTAQYNADNPFAMAVGTASGRKAGQVSYVLCHQPKSFDWRLRDAKAHPLGSLPDSLFGQVCDRLNQIIVLG